MYEILQKIIDFFWGEDRLFGAMRSPEWPKVRARFIEEHSVCEVCGTKKKLEVHHILPVHKYPKLELEFSNLITLCDPHHFVFGHLCSFYSYNDTVREDALVWRSRINKRP